MKAAFYLSESGLDKAYANAYDLIVRGVQKADEKADSFVDDFTPEKMYELIEEGKTTGDFTYLLPKASGKILYIHMMKMQFRKKLREYLNKNTRMLFWQRVHGSEDDIADVLRNASDADLIVEVTNEPLSFPAIP